ncbi:MAG: 4'-phosphopantetheinyl transferase superfamily protein, partial [Caldilineaceae bacterium]|nr:4'-phosphopantetheinyl transferase superfamily protein [Caldilineaceae bacterium]
MNQAVEIWSFMLKIGEHRLPLTEWLSADEEVRATRFHFPQDATKFRIGRAMLRLILSHYVGLPPAALQFDYNTYGKPIVAAAQNHTGLAFNLAHSGEYALCAVTDGAQVGIDLELIRALDYPRLAATIFSPREQEILHNLSTDQQPMAFFNGWTRKEAYVKAHGLGLSMALTDFDVTIAPNEPARLLATRPDAAEVSRWSLYGW